MKQTILFSPGSCAAVLFVKFPNAPGTTMWIYHSPGKVQSTVMLWRELPEEVQDEITLYFTRVFDMCYDLRSEFMQTVRPWEIQINQ